MFYFSSLGKICICSKCNSFKIVFSIFLIKIFTIRDAIMEPTVCKGLISKADRREFSGPSGENVVRVASTRRCGRIILNAGIEPTRHHGAEQLFVSLFASRIFGPRIGLSSPLFVIFPYL